MPKNFGFAPSLTLTLVLVVISASGQTHDQRATDVVSTEAAVDVQFGENQSYTEGLLQNRFATQKSFLTLTVENDMFASDADQNYTSGVRLTYFDTGAQPQALAKLLDQWAPIFEVNETTSVYYSFGQNLYTPADTSRAVPDATDRPYAGFVYLAAGFSSITANHLDELEVTLGIVGPWSVSEQTQKFVHDVIDVEKPQGWDAQLENELGVILSWRRRWPDAFATGFGPFHFRASPDVGVSLGNVYTYGAAGFTLQLTPKQYQWQSQPLRVRPSIPGDGFFYVPEDRFAWSLFAGVEARAMARNIFLDGNTFQSGPSVDKNTFVTDANVGAAMSYGRGQIAYTLIWRSKEFEAQQEASLFGAMSLSYRF